MSLMILRSAFLEELSSKILIKSFEPSSFEPRSTGLEVLTEPLCYSASTIVQNKRRGTSSPHETN